MPITELTPKARRIEPVETMALKSATTPTSVRCADAAEHADETAQQAQRDGLNQELQPDVAGLRADGDADADLAGAFGDAHEHDVHDADAADQERDAGDGPEQQRDDLGNGIDGVGNFLLVEDVEVVVAARQSGDGAGAAGW